VIVVVTGPSAAGKTTWCQRWHPGDLIPEYAPTGHEPRDDDPVVQAAFWCEVDCARWDQAVERERVSGLAVCDDDPLKLHYPWSLARVGLADPRLWRGHLAAHRDAVANGRLGLADLALVSVPSVAELRRRQQSDTTRRRRNFERHVLLAEPLREWYSALERVSPGRVRWHLPDGGISAPEPPVRTDRHDLEVFDRLIEALPPVPDASRDAGTGGRASTS
jgi:hypothetical protein